MTESTPTPSEDLTRDLRAWIERHHGDPDSAPPIRDLLVRTIATAREHPRIDAHVLATCAGAKALALATPKNRPSATTN